MALSSKAGHPTHKVWTSFIDIGYFYSVPLPNINFRPEIIQELSSSL